MAEEKTTERSEFDVELEETPVEETPAAPEENYKEKYEQEHNNFLRLAAEYDNFRKRSQKEKENQIPVEETAETAEVAEETVETPEVAEVNPWEEKYNAERDAHLRVAAEFDNFRKRTIKEKEASYGNGKADAVAKMLPVYDNLERALNQPTEDAAYKKGVEMTMNELVKIFTGLGVEIFGNVGEEFDPNIHNAVMHTEDESLGENTISMVFQKGFKIGEKVVRFAMVQVAN